MTEKRENSGYRYTKEIKKALRHKAAELDCSVQKAIELAVCQFVAIDPTVGSEDSSGEKVGSRRTARLQKAANQ